MSRGLFVTGTDTGCGKTRVAATLIGLLRAQGLRVAGFKPVAAGAEMHDGFLQNDDALTLAGASGIDFPYATVNPYCFAPPIAPHLAAAEAGVRIELPVLQAAFAELAGRADIVLTEGAGGWLVPLDAGCDMAALALALRLPVLLVVGMRLGCINHARLSERAILASGAPLIGWVGSQVDPAMDCYEANLATLDDVLDSPCLGVLPHPRAVPKPATARALRVGTLLAALDGTPTTGRQR